MKSSFYHKHSLEIALTLASPEPGGPSLHYSCPGLTASFLFRLLFCHIRCGQANLSEPSGARCPWGAVAEVETEVQDHIHKGWLLRPLTPGGGKGQQSGQRNTVTFGITTGYHVLARVDQCLDLTPLTPQLHMEEAVSRITASLC